MGFTDLNVIYLVAEDDMIRELIEMRDDAPLPYEGLDTGASWAWQYEGQMLTYPTNTPEIDFARLSVWLRDNFPTYYWESMVIIADGGVRYSIIRNEADTSCPDNFGHLYPAAAWDCGSDKDNI